MYASTEKVQIEARADCTRALLMQCVPPGKLGCPLRQEGEGCSACSPSAGRQPFQPVPLVYKQFFYPRARRGCESLGPGEISWKGWHWQRPENGSHWESQHFLPPFMRHQHFTEVTPCCCLHACELAQVSWHTHAHMHGWGMQAQHHAGYTAAVHL